MDNFHKILRVQFELALPADANEAEVKEWLEFELGYLHSMNMSNPLRNYDLEAIDPPIVTDTCQRFFEREVIEISPTGERRKLLVSERIPIIERDGEEQS